jgi:hypothetical protein
MPTTEASYQSGYFTVLVYSFRANRFEGVDRKCKVGAMPELPSPENSPAITPEQPSCAPVNWEAVRVLAIAVGVRESARRLGISEEATMKRCQREQWLASPEARTINQRVTSEKTSLSAPVRISPAQAMQQELSDLGAKSRLGLARGLAKAAQTVQDMDGDEVLIAAQNIKAVAQSTSVVHAWDKQGPSFRIKLDVLQADHKAAIEVDSEVVTDQTWDDQEPV